MAKFKRLGKRIASGLLCFLYCITIASSSSSAAHAAALELGASAIISGLVAYLSASGITYASDGGTIQDIVDSISEQITPWATTEYGSLDSFYGDVRSLSQPLNILNGNLSISSSLSAIYSKVRTWLVENIFSQEDSVVVSSLPGSMELSVYFNGQYHDSMLLRQYTNANNSLSYAEMVDYLIVIPSSTIPGIGNKHGILVTFSNVSADTYLNIYKTDTSYYFDFHVNGLDTPFSITGPADYLCFGLCNCRSPERPDNGGTVYYGGSMSDILNHTYYYSFTSGRGPIVSDYVAGSSFLLRSDYDSAVSAPVVAQGQALTVPTDTTMIQGLDAKLDAILEAVQAGAGAVDGTIEQAPANVAPAVYQPGEAYALDLTTVFPFSIPWDLYRATQLFVAEPEAPVIRWDVPLPSGETTPLVLDFSVFDGLASLARKLELLLFVIGLALATKKIIKW